VSSPNGSKNPKTGVMIPLTYGIINGGGVLIDEKSFGKNSHFIVNYGRS
jgi:hypothetical protein